MVLGVDADNNDGDITFYVDVIASDAGSPPRETTARFYFNLLQVNEFAPQFTSDEYSIDVLENSTVGDKFNSVVSLCFNVQFQIFIAE